MTDTIDALPDLRHRSFDEARGFLDRIDRAVHVRETKQASATPARAIPQKWLNREESWQRRVREYDRNGPGFLGYVFDTKAQVASMVPLHMEQMDRRGVWSRTADASAQAALAAFIGIGNDQDNLVYSQFRSLESVGEYWLAAVDTPEGLRWVVAQTPQLDFKANDTVILRTRREESPNDPTVYRLSRNQVVRCHHPDPEWSGEAYSAVRRALPDIERYRSTVRNIARTLDSRLLTNGLIWFAPDDPDRPSRPSPDTPIQTVEQVMSDYTEIAWKALNDDSDFAAYAPFPVSGANKPEFVDVGRSLDPEVLAAETKALEAVGRSLDYPQQLLVQGPGAGNHWSDLLLKDDFLNSAIAPGLGEVCGYISTVAVRPLLEVMRARGANLEDPVRYRVWYDLSDVAKRPDTSDQMLSAWRDGIASFEAVGQSIGLSHDELLPLPEGITEYEHWRESHSKTAGLAPGASAPSAASPPAAPNPAQSPSMQTAAASSPDHSTGVMIALVPDRPQTLAVADGLDPSDLHVTLGYFGTVDNISPDRQGELLAAVEDLATRYQPLDLRISGTGYLGDDDPQATVFLVENPDLGAIHDAAIAAAAGAGVPNGSSHPGFIGHMTIGYGVERPATVVKSFRASTIRLTLGPETHDVSLGSGKMAAASRAKIRVAAPTQPVNIGPKLTNVDRRLFDRIRTAAEIALAAAIANAGRAVLRALPQGELRSSLRNVPLSDVWFSVPQEIRDQVGITETDVLGDNPFGSLDEDVLAAFEASDEQTDRVLGGAGIGPGPKAEAAAATAFLMAGLSAFAVSRLNNPNPPPPTRGEYDQFRAVPPSLVRDTLRVSAGASHSSTALVSDPVGRPQLPDNGKWVGGDGPATGPTTVDYLENLGVIASPITYQWIHGDAARPFEPHEALDGTEYTEEDRDSVLANADSFPDGEVYFPGDHSGCTCYEGMVLELTVGIIEPGADGAPEGES